MADAASEIFSSLSSWRQLQALVDNGEAEGLHLECKAPSQPRLNRDMKVALGKAVSGFANTAGGVVLWGVATTRLSHSGLDVITQLEPIGNCRSFEKQVRSALPAVTTPSLLEFHTKVLTRRQADTRGIVVALIPPSPDDPYISNLANVFYFRSADAFVPAPYDLIKRLFAATESPDLQPHFTADLVSTEPDGTWKIPIVLANRASAAAEHVEVFVTIENASACSSIASPAMTDQSGVNPGLRAFAASPNGVIHRAMNFVVGELRVRMKVGSRPKRRLDLSIDTYASRMRARNVKFSLSLAKAGFSVKKTAERFLY